MNRSYIYDIETYPNFFLAAFKRVDMGNSDEIINFTFEQIDELRAFIKAPGDLPDIEQAWFEQTLRELRSSREMMSIC